MVQAYILIQTEVGKARDVAAAIAEIAGVVRVDAVTGPYDVVVLTEAHTVDELGKMIVSKVQYGAGHHPHPHLLRGKPLTMVDLKTRPAGPTRDPDRPRRSAALWATAGRRAGGRARRGLLVFAQLRPEPAAAARARRPRPARRVAVPATRCEMAAPRWPSAPPRSAWRCTSQLPATVRDLPAAR